MSKGTDNNRAVRILAFTASLGLGLAPALSLGAQAAAGAGSAPPESAAVPSAAADPKGAGGKAAAPVPSVPKQVIEGALSGNPQGLEQVRKFLVGDQLRAEAVTERAMALVRALRAAPASRDPQQFLAISARVSEIAKSIFQNTSITRITVDKRFHPGPRDKAWKFGPPDAESPAGFEKVTPQDTRLKGVNMRGVHRPGSDPLTSSGIMGVRNFESELPNGKWRVILITDDLGQPQTALAPLGQTVQVNSTQVSLLQEDPSQWLEHAYLTNQNIKLGGGAPEGGLPAGLNIKDGVVTHQRTPPAGGQGASGDQALSKEDIASTSAGALTLQTNVGENRLGVGFVPPSNRTDQDTYIVAIIAEPATQPPAIKGQVNALDIEAKIFSQAVNLTEAPKAGKPVSQSLQPPPTPGIQATGPQPPTPEQQPEVIPPPHVPSASAS